MDIVIDGMVGNILLAFTRDHFLSNFWGWLLKTSYSPKYSREKNSIAFEVFFIWEQPYIYGSL